MSKCFNYILAQFKVDDTTFCNMKQSCFHDLFKKHYQVGLEEKPLINVSFLKDVSCHLESECDTSCLAIDELMSLLFVLCT